MVPRILVVDDEANMLKLFQKVLSREGFEIRTCRSGTEAIRLMRQEHFDLIISDLVMPVLSGMDLMKEIRIHYPEIPFIVITAYGSIQSAVEAMRAGAFDYLTKPFQKDDVLLVIRKALKVCELNQEVRRLREELKAREGFQEIIFKSKAMEGVFKLISKVADSQATVLIQGESGTGKELIARALHDLSNRRMGPFIAVDCSVLPEPLLQTELFGHVKGAFTGALKNKQGLFSAADGGTLFLDEIGNISPAVQLNLLRVLQEREIKPVGSVASLKVDVRVVAATNTDLELSMRKGTFRKELYYRLAVLTVTVPSLRERKEDIAPLTYHFMRKYAGIYHKDITDISPQALRGIMENSWPGNVRELENVMERAVLLSTGPVLDETALAIPVRKLEPPEERTLKPLKEAGRELAREGEREVLEMALTQAGGNKTRAARLLGISRSSLYNKMKELGLP
jgi:DNA-binding NtrC family response regulator